MIARLAKSGPMIRKISIAFALAVSIGGTASAGPRAVVELFTSQGCSSCPPADRIVGEMTKREDVLPLAYHVGYWDYLGWKDTFGIEEATERQTAYAAVQENRRLFTPEVIVNGLHHVVGSDEAKIEKAVGSVDLPVPVSISYDNGELEISVGDSGSGTGKATVRLVTYLSKADVMIERGENRGSTITYHNVVRSISPVGIYEGAPLTITLPADEIMEDGADGCAVIVQEELAQGPGRIVGAASARHAKN